MVKSINELEGGLLLIVGQTAGLVADEELVAWPGPDETAIIIDKALLATIRDEVREECVKALELSASMSPFPSKYAEAVDAIRALKETPDE